MNYTGDNDDEIMREAASLVDDLDDKETTVNRWSDIDSFREDEERVFGTERSVLEDMHAYAKSVINRVNRGGYDCLVPMSELRGKLGAELVPPKLSKQSAPAPSSNEISFEGVISYTADVSTPVDEIRFHPVEKIKQRHLFTLESRPDIVFFNANVFAAIPHAFRVNFFATRSASKFKSKTGKEYTTYRVTRLVYKRAAQENAVNAVIQLAAHAQGKSPNAVTLQMRAAGFDVANDRMMYTKAVESHLYEGGLVDMPFVGEGFQKSSFLGRFRLACEVFDCVQFIENAERDKEYTKRWIEANRLNASKEAADEAARKEIYELQRQYSVLEPPLRISIARHPECVQYFASPALEALAPLFGEQALLGVQVEQLWALYGDIYEDKAAKAPGGLRGMHDTAYGMCFHEAFKNTRCSFGAESHGIRNPTDFTLADIASYPTEYLAVHGPRMPIPLPEVSFVGLSLAPQVCRKLGPLRVMEIMVYNLMKQAATEDKHSCVAVCDMIERVSVETMGLPHSKRYERLRDSYHLTRHRGNEESKAAVLAACYNAFGNERHAALAQFQRHRHALTLVAIGELVNKKLLFLEKECVAELHRKRCRSPNAKLLETTEDDHRWHADFYTDEALAKELQETDEGRAFKVMRQMYDRLVLLQWKDRQRYRLYLPEAYYEEEMILQSLARHASSRRALLSVKPRLRNAFYKQARDKKWTSEEIKEKAATINAMLADMEEAWMTAVENGREDDEDLLLAEACQKEGMERVYVAKQDLAPDQRLAVEMIENSKYGVVVLHGLAGSGKTAIAKALRDKSRKTDFLACAFMNAHCRNMQRALDGVSDSNVLTSHRLVHVHDELCRNQNMRDFVEESNFYKKDALARLAVFGYLNNVSDYDKCPLENLRTLFVDEFSAMPRSVFAQCLYIVSHCAPKLVSIVIAGNNNQLPSVAPSPLAFAIPYGLGYVATTSKWRYRNAVTMHNVEAILSGAAEKLILFERGNEQNYPDKGYTEESAPTVLVNCHSVWKRAYYNEYADDAVGLLVEDYEKGLLPHDQFLVVAPSNDMAREINRHLCTAELRSLAKSADAVVAQRAADDMARYKITPERQSRSSDTLLPVGCFYRGQRVVATTAMDQIGIPNRSEFKVGDDVHFRVLHIAAAEFEFLQQNIVEAICDAIRGYAAECMDEAVDSTPLDCFVRAYRRNAKQAAAGEKVPLGGAVFSAVVESRAQQYLTEVIEEHAKAQRLSADALLKMTSAGLSDKRVLQFISCGGTGARKCHWPSVASSAHYSPATIEERLCLHSIDAAEWKYCGRAPVQPTSSDSRETEALTEWLQNKTQVGEHLDRFVEKHGAEDMRESLMPLLKRCVKRVSLRLMRQIDGEESRRLEAQLRVDIQNSLLSDRSNPERPPQAALRLALEEHYLAEGTGVAGVSPSDYIAAVDRSSISASRLSPDAPVLRFKKLYETSARVDGAPTRLVYYPATPASLERLAPATAQTCFSAQSQEKPVAAVVMPSRENINYLFTAFTRAQKQVRIYSSRKTIQWTLSSYPNVRYSVLAAKLRYMICVDYAENESLEHSPSRRRLRTLCKNMSEQHRERMQPTPMEGESEEETLLRLCRHARAEPFVEPAEAGIPVHASPNDRWMLEELAQNGDILFRPNGLPCNRIGLAADEVNDDGRWETEEEEECAWRRQMLAMGCAHDGMRRMKGMMSEC